MRNIYVCFSFTNKVGTYILKVIVIIKRRGKVRKFSIYLMVIILVSPIQFISNSTISAQTIDNEMLLESEIDINDEKEEEVENLDIDSGPVVNADNPENIDQKVKTETKIDNEVEVEVGLEAVKEDKGSQIQNEKPDQSNIGDNTNVTEEQVAGTTAQGAVEIKTSKLGHIRNSDVLIYESIGGNSFKASSQYMDAVYYIKKQANVGSKTYYLISTDPSDTKGVVGWIESSDLSTHDHTGVDKKAKTFYLNGKGKATTKAWGGHKDAVYANLSTFKDKVFNVHLTEKVGNNIWYRGILEGKTVWIHSSYAYDAEHSKTSKLGHLKNTNSLIYEKIDGQSIKAGTKYTDAVYFIKEQAISKGQLYYLISMEPSATKGAIGWVKSGDISTHDHVGVDKKTKKMYIKGNGKATTKAWGGHKDAVYSNLSSYKGREFIVHLTEKVGNNIWYRGTLNGKTVWLHSNYLNEKEETSTSMLGHLKNGNSLIYDSIGGKAKSAGKTYTDKVYYIKLQAKIGNEIYYLISTQPSAISGVVGWVKPADISTNLHSGLNKDEQILYINGKGKATTKAWGGHKDAIFSSLNSLKGELLQVNLTEKVGNNIWYRGKLSGRTVWVHSSSVTSNYVTSTDYRLTLNDAVDMQWSALQNHNEVKVKPTKAQVSKMMDVENFIQDSKERFQFLNLNNPSGATAAMLNRYLNNNTIYNDGSLKGQGQAFYDAARIHNMNDVYIIAHTRLETGNGKSPLSSGNIEVGEYGINKWMTIESDRNNPKKIHIVECITSGSGCQWKVTRNDYLNPSDAKNKKTTYNMFGIGAIDGYANEVGSVTAYRNGWTSATKAIVDGVGWIKGSYINNQYGQNTLYKMRWNPHMVDGAGWKQYATDIGWASKQAILMYNLYDEIGVKENYHFDIPIYIK